MSRKPNTRICTIVGCGKREIARSWCSMHYQRWQEFGDANVDFPDTPTKRFWLRVKKTDGCWLWMGAIAGRYGQMARKPAHRFSWELHYGPIPNGLFACHTCDNKLCVRPDHLFLGDASANMRDMVQKGRHPKQLRSYRAKLKPQDVHAIRSSDKGAGILARHFGVDPSTILHIRKRLTWRHI